MRDWKSEYAAALDSIANRGRKYLWERHLIGGKEPIAGSTRTDSNPHGTGATRAVPFVGGALTIYVNPLIDATTGKLNAQESS